MAQDIDIYGNPIVLDQPYAEAPGGGLMPFVRPKENPPPINREDGVVSAVPQPTYPAINIPDVITPDFFNRPPSADRQRIENDLNQRRQEYLTSFQQTQREQQLQTETQDLDTQLTNLRQSEAKGQFNIEQQRIAMPLVTGQQAALSRQAQLERGDVLAQLESKQKALGYEVTKREGLMAKAKAAIGFAESDLERIGKLEQNQFEREKAILDYAQKLGDNARQTLGIILSKFEGMGWNDLSEQSRTGLANLAAQAGIDPFIIAQGLETQKDSMMVKQEKDKLEMEKIKKELNLPAKLNTAFTEANGRRLLVNMDTSEVLADLGVSELPKDTSQLEGMPNSYKEWMLAGQQGTYGDWLKNTLGFGELTDKELAAVDKTKEAENLKLVSDLKASALRYKDTLNTYGYEAFGVGKTLLDNTYAELQVKWKEAARLGALTGPDLQLILDAVKPATGLRGAYSVATGGGVSGISTGVDAMITRLDEDGLRNFELLKTRNTKYKDNPYVNALGKPFESGGKNGGAVILEGTTSSGIKYKVTQ